MTLLVAVLCQGGVVVGADSGATFGTQGVTTVMQRTTKIDTLGGRGLVGVSGPVGLGQRFIADINTALQRPDMPNEPALCMERVASLLRPHIATEASAAQALIPFVGVQVAAGSVMSASVLAICLAGQPHLFQFEPSGAPEQATSDLPFICVGSGQMLGDPFMGFLRDVLFPAAPALPTINQGTLATLWTLKHAIGLATHGLQDPARLYVLETGRTGCRSRELEEGDLAEHYQAISALTAQLREFRMQAIEVEPPPAP